MRFCVFALALSARSIYPFSVRVLSLFVCVLCTVVVGVDVTLFRERISARFCPNYSLVPFPLSMSTFPFHVLFCMFHLFFYTFLLAFTATVVRGVALLGS